MSCDVQTLLDESSCFSCISPGFWDLMELQLLCNWNSNVKCTNIVPLGATYFEGVYSLLGNGVPLIVGHSYIIVFGVNDSDATNFGQPDIISPGPGIPVHFTATDANLILDSGPGHLNDPVTATVCEPGV